MARMSSRMLRATSANHVQRRQLTQKYERASYFDPCDGATVNFPHAFNSFVHVRAFISQRAFLLLEVVLLVLSCYSEFMVRFDVSRGWRWSVGAVVVSL